MLTFEEFIKMANDADNDYDIAKITAAYELADSAHAGQVRKSGEPYICHPLNVAMILLDMGMDTDTIVSALLHDVVEDTDITLETLRQQFGEEVSELVDGVTKINALKFKTTQQEGGYIPQMPTREAQNAENTRKLLIAMAKNNRVLIVKLADRLHNMRTLDAVGHDKQRRIALETMNFYAPLANRMGIARIKDEMENLSLYYLDPFAYKEIEENLESHQKERESFIEVIIARLREVLSDISPTPVIEGRVKGIYSLYRKMYKTGRSLEEIFDLYAFRVITDTSYNCFQALARVHETFSAVPNRFKDYINAPKVNGYQSLHTIVLGKQGQPFEVQFRTHEMHKTARYGIAAHWRYKLGINSKTKNIVEARFDAIRQLLENPVQSSDLDDLAEAVKTDLSPDEVYVMTPIGEVKCLPKGSTVVDFAYSVHTEVGNKMVGAKVQGKQVSFDYELRNGNIVEIRTSDSSNGPNRSWLDYAKTTDAKSKIIRWLKRERMDENISSGRAYVDSVIRSKGIAVTQEELIELAHKHHYTDLNEFYAAIGYGGVSTKNATLWISDAFGKVHVSPPHVNVLEQIDRNRKKKQSESVIIEGVSDCRTKFANCCNPFPGDEIVGFVTRGYGVSIHKKDCDNIAKRMMSEEDKSRLIGATWSNTHEDVCTASIELVAVDRRGLLSEISTAIFENHIFIISSNSHILKNGNSVFNYSLEISGLEQLKSIMSKLNKIQGVISVERKRKA